MHEFKRGFQVTAKKAKTKVITLTHHKQTGTNCTMNQSGFLAITCNLLKARKSGVYKVRLVSVLLLILIG